MFSVYAGFCGVTAGSLYQKSSVAVLLRLLQNWCGYFPETAVIVLDKAGKCIKMQESF